AKLAEEEGIRRSELARDVYSYLHLPMVAGIVLFAFGLKTTLPLADKGIALGTIPAIGLCGGLALYFLAHVAVRLRLDAALGGGAKRTSRSARRPLAHRRRSRPHSGSSCSKPVGRRLVSCRRRTIASRSRAPPGRS